MIEVGYITGFMTGISVGKNTIIPGEVEPTEPTEHPTFDATDVSFDSNEFTFDNETT